MQKRVQQALQDSAFWHVMGAPLLQLPSLYIHVKEHPTASTQTTPCTRDEFEDSNEKQ